MNTQQEAAVRALGPSAVAARKGFALPRFQALPNHLAAAITIVGLFAAIVLAIALIYDAPLTIPRERVSAALGMSAVLPVAFALVVYGVLRSLKALFKRSSQSDASVMQVVGVDLTLMVLFVIVTYFHFSLKAWVQVINPNLYDAQYFAIDQQFRVVIDVFYWIRSNIFTAVPNTDVWYQTAFLLMFISGFCHLAIVRNAVYPKFCIGVLLTMSLGGLSYLAAPALGPFIYEDGLNSRATEAQAGMLWAHEQVLAQGMPWIAAAGPDYFTGALAAMPSLHIAHAVVMTYFAVQARSPLCPLFFVICFWVMIESVATRWHYLIDLPFGLLVAVAAIWLTNAICRAPSRELKPS